MKPGVYKRNLVVPLLKIVIDAVAVLVSVPLSFYIRFHSHFTKIIAVRDNYIPPLENYLYFSVVLAAVYLILFSINHSYRSRIFTSFPQDIPVIFKVSLQAMVVAFSIAFFYRGFSYSRLVFVFIFIITILFLLIGRFIFHRMKYVLLSRGFNVLRVILVGSGHIVPRIYEKVGKDRNYNLEIRGYVAEQALAELPVAYLGNMDSLPELLKKDDIDGMLLAFGQNDHHHLMSLVNLTEGKNTEIFYIPDILDILTSNFNHLEIGGIPVLQLKSFTLSGWQGFLKRGFDILLSGAGLLLLSPLFLLVALLIKITSKGPVFYLQQRVTMDNRDFTMIKFRSMVVSEESKEGLLDVVRNDPRVTAVGKILRRTSLDELPQLWNVLKGDMSLVGPRPERRYYVEENIGEIPRYAERHRVRTGITGWAQVNGLRQQDTPLDERIRFDLYYIENWSLWFDLKILILTGLEVIRGSDAY
jgi:exopolysaccharide biosynthesis polyprenyl glycosylphosphotransferase